MGPGDEKWVLADTLVLACAILSGVLFLRCAGLFTIFAAVLSVSQPFIFVPVEKYGRVL